MPVYVYGCDQDKGHPRVEVAHAIGEEIGLKCSECRGGMHRIPQPLRGWYRNPVETLIEWSSANYRLLRSGSKRRISPHKVNRIEGTLPQSEYRRR